MEHLEGRQSVLAALRVWKRTFQHILISYRAHEEKVAEVIALAEEKGVPWRKADPGELEAIAHGTTHGGVVAVCSAKPKTTPDELLDLIGALDEPPLLLLLEGVEDARNLGFTLRSAEALGVHAVMIKKHLWDLNPIEIARPASGAYERLPIVQVQDIAVLELLQGRGLKLYGCLANARRTMYNADLATGCIITIGGEKRGISGAVRNICDAFLTIPSVSEVSSLSLSHASAIVMAEAMRQRKFTGTNRPGSPGVPSLPRRPRP
jgi:23S rRNA (guanosine2251-2'-O)-methyltransferase